MATSLSRRQLLLDGSKAVVGTSLLGSLLAACGASAPTTGEATTQSLRYWVLAYQPKGSNATGKLTDAALAAFKKAHTNITVQPTGYTGDNAGFTKLSQAVRGGGQVDVLRLPSDILHQFVKQGSLAPTDDFLTAEDKADIYPHLLEAVKVEGKYYSWPLWVPPVGMYLNLDIFKERGVELPKENWTYEEFVDIAKRLTFTRTNEQKIYGYTALVDAGVVNSWPIILGEGGLPLNKENTQYTFNSPEGIKGLQKLVDLARVHKVTPPDFGSQAVADIQSGFGQNKTYAMYSEPSGQSASYKAIPGLNFKIHPMPIGSTGKHITAGGIGLISVANIKDQEKLKAAMELARYLTGSQVSKDVNGYYLAPGSRKSVTVKDPISQFTPFVEYCYITPMISQWPEIRTILHTQIQKAIQGQLSPAEALNAPASEITAILSRK
jgi:multiple sugar transport system substrate-binding protein